MRFRLERVHYMPKVLEPRVLYVSEEFGAAAHLCACGCGSKVRTPLHPTEWRLEETQRGPSLFPSVGNWEQSCQSHDWIREGEVLWRERWTPEEIAAGRQREETRRHAYYDDLETRRVSAPRRLWRWIRKILAR